MAAVLALPLNVKAQETAVFDLPLSGQQVNSSPVFMPAVLQGLVVKPKEPFHFDFIVDAGQSGLDASGVGFESQRLVKYFLAALTVPDNDIWVNLSPYERQRIIPEALGQTDLGRDLLAQDYILKQLTATLIDPQKDLGKEFWSRVYAQARAKFGNDAQVPVNTFNKVWILPDEAGVFERNNAVYITRATLKIMTEED